MNYVIDRHVPKQVTSHSKGPPWQTAELRRLKSRKRAALRKYSKRGGLLLRNDYLRINNRYKHMSRECYSNHLRNVQSRLKSDPKAFWKYVNEQRKVQGLPSTMTYGVHKGSDMQTICNLFAEKFSSVFVNESLSADEISVAASNVPLSGQSLSVVLIDDSKIQAALSKLKPSSSAGPDGIPAILLKKCSAGVLVPLCHLFRLSIAAGDYPSLWKSAFMFPVHKKGDRRNIDNYRGISALNAVSQLFELVMLEPIFNHCEPVIAETQHGFMPKRSTTTNLLTFTTFATDSMSKGLQTDAIYTDLSAAFDKINHSIAIAKLSRLGFGGNVLRWLQSYLADRYISVKIGDRLSNVFHATSGIPQGSHLGPLIFLLYFNDVNLVLEGPRLSFADDMKLYAEIRNLDDALFLQRQLDIFARWCTVNRMVLNSNKCSVISITRKKQPVMFNYRLEEVSIKREHCVKDLGVMIDAQLTFKDHIGYTIGKASRNLGLIMRIARSFKDVHCLKSLYCSLVRSTLEYCSTVWNPHYLNGVNRIEAIQRRFIRFALRHLPWNNPHQLPSYENRALLIGLDTLHVRREASRAMLVSDLLMARTDCSALLSSININVNSRATRNNVFLRVPFRRTNYGINGAVNGLQRAFNRVSSGFDYHLPRSRIRQNFIDILRNDH